MQRIGSLSAFTLGSLTRIEDYGVYKVTIYEGTNNEYYTFTTREFANAYEDRQRCGEKIIIICVYTHIHIYELLVFKHSGLLLLSCNPGLVVECY